MSLPDNYSKIIWLQMFERFNQDYLQLLSSLGGVEKLPDAFSLSGEKWDEAEAAIYDAIVSNNILLTKKLCADYEQRTQRFLNGWREKLGITGRAA